MATRAEQFRNQEQRRASRTESRLSSSKPASVTNGSSVKAREVPSRAAYALEAPAADGHRSRKSTRASANRVKPDTSFNLRESLVKGSPEQKYRKARAKSTRVRGSKV